MKKYFIVSVIAMTLSAQTSWATPTGLNNIPTADVVPEKVLVLQGIVEVGDEKKPGYVAGFKYGLIKNLEVGLDGRIFPEAVLEETLKGQMKYRFEFNDKMAMAAGIANLGDRAKLGWEDYYLVATHNFGFLRAHLGGTFQKDNEGGFAGLDKMVPLFERNLTLRADIIQTNDSHDTTASMGFIYDIGFNFLLESWISLPSQSGKEEVITIKTDYVVKF